ncbi:MnmC family methyltransferase [Prochlorococcus sp. SS52]|uniref:MnmC family methyltransferase n=1 Tax=Prochlorococcus sp. SS52 TaxID=1499501 RepID=UPI00068E380E|nr:MnmC family methyltransferase [Prochlorococcus sp. SS52]
MILKDLEIESTNFYEKLNHLDIIKTKDGSISLKSSEFKEPFHCSLGAKKEALEKFIYPSDLKNYERSKNLFTLDVCFGMGYNTACLMEELHNHKISLNWWGLEKDKSPLTIALNKDIYTSGWSNETLSNLKAIQCLNHWKTKSGEGQMLWGDARQQIHLIPHEIKFDLIFLDPFSPQKCPELWTEEFLKTLSRKLSKKGRIITYCTAAAIRATLRRTGLEIRSILPTNLHLRDWSIGTIASKDFEIEKNTANSVNLWQSLTQMEEAHLKTNASIPYRDPHGKSSKEEILKRRAIEQQSSNFEATSSWKKRWINTKSN